MYYRPKQASRFKLGSIVSTVSDFKQLLHFKEEINSWDNETKIKVYTNDHFDYIHKRK